MDDEKSQERITFDNVEDSDALHIFARVTKDNVHYKIYIETWLKDYLRKYPDGRDHFIEQFVNALNGAIDEDA